MCRDPALARPRRTFGYFDLYDSAAEFCCEAQGRYCVDYVGRIDDISSSRRPVHGTVDEFRHLEIAISRAKLRLVETFDTVVQ